MATELAIVETKVQKPTSKRERIQTIETRPEPGWFIRAKDVDGRSIWFLRFQMTGFRPRRYGQFASKKKAILFLDNLLGEMMDGLTEAEGYIEDYQIKERPFAHRSGHYPVVEDELIAAPIAKKGR